MRSVNLLSAATAIVLASAQDGAPPPPVLLTTTKSGVLPIIPTETPFTGLLTNQGAILQPGPVKPGFVGPGGTATAETALPAATYVATFPPEMFDPLVGTVISGSVTGVGTDSGVLFTVNVSGLPDVATYGPFGYHVHNLPVPASGNCTETMGHLDPYNRGEYYMCDKSAPQTCQAGDLSGKHGTMMMPDSFETSYTDAYLSTDPASRAYFGSLSVVIHTSNRTRLTCANFMMVNGGNSSMPMPTGTGVYPPGPTSSIEPFPGEASRLGWSGVGAMLMGFAYMLF